MAKNKVTGKEMKECECNHKNKGMSGGGVYGFGMIGAAVYYIQNAQNFQEGVIGILKAVVWPALLIHKILELLKF